MGIEIKLKTIPADNGIRKHDVARVCIDGITFSADIVGDVFERQLNRIAEKYEAEIVDLRAGELSEKDVEYDKFIMSRFLNRQ